MDAEMDDKGDNLCRHCSRQFVRHRNLVQHMINQHQEEMGFTADVPIVLPASSASAPAASLDAQAGGTPANPRSFSLYLPSSGRDPIGGRAGQPAAPPCAFLSPTPPSPPPNASAVPVLGNTAERVRSYYAAFGDMERTRMLVSSSSTQPSVFDTSELKDMCLFALYAGGKGFTQKARAEYYQSTICAERAALRAQRDAEARALGKVLQELSGDQSSKSDGTTPGDARSTRPAAAGSASRPAHSSSRGMPARPPKKIRLRKRVKAAVLAAQAELQAVSGPLETAFPIKSSLVNSLKGQTARCLAEQGWRVTNIVDGEDTYIFYSRDVMAAALNTFIRATSRCMRDECKYAADGSILRCDSLDSDLYLREQADVERIHAGRFLNGKPLKVFIMAAQFFSDATLVSKNGGKCEHHRVPVPRCSLVVDGTLESLLDDCWLTFAHVPSGIQLSMFAPSEPVSPTSPQAEWSG